MDASLGIFTLLWRVLGDRRICRSRVNLKSCPQLSAVSSGPYFVDQKLNFLVKKLKSLAWESLTFRRPNSLEEMFGVLLTSLGMSFTR